MPTKFTRSLFFILSCLISFCCCLPGRSQDTNSPTTSPPPRPYVGTLKGDFTFVEKLAYKSKPPASNSADSQTATPPPPSGPPDLAEFDSVQTGALRKDKQVFVDGTSCEIWRSGALRFILQSANPGTVLVASQMLSYYVDPAEFKELEWLGASSFQGEQALNDKTYYVYKKGTETAWIDKSTLLPLFFDSESVHITYTYGTPDAPLQLPTICAQKLQQMKRSWSGLPN